MKGNHLIETKLISCAGLAGAGTIGRTTGCLDELQDIAMKLTEIQKMYDNNDSILIVPLSEDYARAMKIIGQEVDIDLILHSKNTLFF